LSVQRLTFLTLFSTYILIVFGGYVASSESGMGCGPEWPLCNGVYIPSLHGETLVEYVHRVIGIVLGIMTIILCIQIFQLKPSFRVRLATYWMLTLFIIQILLGAIVVVRDLPATIITIHLLVAMIYMALLIFIWRSYTWENQFNLNNSYDNTGIRRYILTHIHIILVLLLITITLGAYIKHEQYGLACDWLGCRETFLPSDDSQLLQTLHRIFAVITTIYTLLFAGWIFTKSRDQNLRKRVVLAVIVVIAQMLVGIIAIITNLELSWAVTHLAIATALFGIIIETRVYLRYSL
jgi:cytochrome c oxidase assembly protein subunit 15